MGRTPRLWRARGFTMVELLTVVAIIIIVSAASMPAIANYLRLYKVRGAAGDIATELQAARLKAITKSVNLGVVFIPGYPKSDQYQFLLEDTTATGATANRNVRVAIPPTTAPVDGEPNGTIQVLPIGVTFVNVAGGARGVRFNNLGMACVTGSATSCPTPSPDPGGNTYVATAGGDMLIQVSYRGIIKTVRVTGGGRAVVQ